MVEIRWSLNGLFFKKKKSNSQLVLEPRIHIFFFPDLLLWPHSSFSGEWVEGIVSRWQWKSTLSWLESCELNGSGLLLSVRFLEDVLFLPFNRLIVCSSTQRKYIFSPYQLLIVLCLGKRWSSHLKIKVMIFLERLMTVPKMFKICTTDCRIFYF